MDCVCVPQCKNSCMAARHCRLQIVEICYSTVHRTLDPARTTCRCILFLCSMSTRWGGLGMGAGVSIRSLYTTVLYCLVLYHHHTFFAICLSHLFVKIAVQTAAPATRSCHVSMVEGRLSLYTTETWTKDKRACFASSMSDGIQAQYGRPCVLRESGIPLSSYGEILRIVLERHGSPFTRSRTPIEALIQYWLVLYSIAWSRGMNGTGPTRMTQCALPFGGVASYCTIPCAREYFLCNAKKS